MEFIIDEQRKNALIQIKRRMTVRRPVLLHGTFGVGKSALLTQIAAENPRFKRVSGIGSVTQILGEMAGVTAPKPYHKQHYINQIKTEKAGFLIDESHKIKRELFVYLKYFIESGCFFILAGLGTEIETDLPMINNTDSDVYRNKFGDSVIYINETAEKMKKAKREDVLSRFIRIKINELPLADLERSLTERFAQKAIICIFSRSQSMRVRVEVVDDCLAYAEQQGIALITEEIAEKIFPAEL